MITFEERWKINKKRRAQGKGDITVRFVTICNTCQKTINREYRHYCSGFEKQIGINFVEKVIVNYR